MKLRVNISQIQNDLINTGMNRIRRLLRITAINRKKVLIVVILVRGASTAKRRGPSVDINRGGLRCSRKFGLLVLVKSRSRICQKV